MSNSEFNLHSTKAGNGSFNSRTAKGKSHPLDELSELSGGNVRPSDLDGIDPAIVLEVLRGKGKRTKTALHGLFNENGGFNRLVDPYSQGTSSLVRPPMPERWRTLPSGGTNNTNEGDNDGNLKGDFQRDDYQPLIQREDILDKTEGRFAPQFVVRKMPSQGEVPTLQLAQEIFGEEGRCDGHSVYMIVKGRENAFEVAKEVGGFVETKGGKQ